MFRTEIYNSLNDLACNTLHVLMGAYETKNVTLMIAMTTKLDMLAACHVNQGVGIITHFDTMAGLGRSEYLLDDTEREALSAFINIEEGAPEYVFMNARLVAISRSSLELRAAARNENWTLWETEYQNLNELFSKMLSDAKEASDAQPQPERSRRRPGCSIS